VIDGGILPSSRDRLLASWREATDVQFLDLGRGLVEELPIHYAYASRATYLRLLLPDMLPASAARVIYLDPDVLVRADLAQLWQIDLGSYALAAAREMYSPTVSSENGLDGYRELSLEPDTPYLNAGVLVIDTRRWRELQVGREAINYVRRHQPYHQDQDGLNAVVAGRFLELHPSWNVSRYWDRPERRRGVFADLAAEARILHFLGPDKPWHRRSAVPAWKRNLFFHYLERTAWRGWVPGA
jgi:lipopolysaccharide biosynthesis glycosyltransferase